LGLSLEALPLSSSSMSAGNSIEGAIRLASAADN
jgi:hypothetical protein